MSVEQGPFQLSHLWERPFPLCSVGLEFTEPRWRVKYSRLLLGTFIPYSPGYEISLILHSMVMSPTRLESMH